MSVGERQNIDLIVSVGERRNIDLIVSVGERRNIDLIVSVGERQNIDLIVSVGVAVGDSCVGVQLRTYAVRACICDPVLLLSLPVQHLDDDH